MKKIVFVLTMMLGCLSWTSSHAQDAKKVLDKCAAAVSSKNGVQADFTMNSAQYGDTSGRISVKGRMFTATTSMATLWFDGKTLWTYMANNDEVNVTTPSDSQLQVMNPYNFINMYKNGYKYTMEKKNGHFIVHLTASGKKSISEMYITINQKSYVPSQVRYKTGKGWIIIDIRNFKAASLADGLFRFNAKDFPNAEVIDLR